MSQCLGFPPIRPTQAKIMILGTMPSVKSMEERFYYAHPRNAFWPIISHLAKRSLSTECEKTEACIELGILLWDVLQACEREGSLDSAIQQPKANDFESIFLQYPQLNVVYFNGQTALKLFKQHVWKVQSLPKDLELVVLPSTSPANARLKIDDKIMIWEEKLSPFL